MVVIVFRSRIRAGTEQGLLADGERMYELATAMPGFVSYKDFAAEGGENPGAAERARALFLRVPHPGLQHRARLRLQARVLIARVSLVDAYCLVPR
jgi:hypothetical protein